MFHLAGTDYLRLGSERESHMKQVLQRCTVLTWEHVDQVWSRYQWLFSFVCMRNIIIINDLLYIQHDHNAMAIQCEYVQNVQIAIYCYI